MRRNTREHNWSNVIGETNGENNGEIDENFIESSNMEKYISWGVLRIATSKEVNVPRIGDIPPRSHIAYKNLVE
jgi:hypothetical protein